MTNDPVLWIDPLHDLSVEFAAKSWGIGKAETWGILSRAIKNEELSSPIPAQEFTEYIQHLAPVFLAINNPPLNAEHLGEVPAKQAEGVLNELHQSAQTPPTSATSSWIAMAILLLLILAYIGWINHNQIIETIIGGMFSIALALFMLYQNSVGKIRLSFKAGLLAWLLLLAGFSFLWQFMVALTK